MSTNLIQPSFAAGELSEHLHARVDLAKYHIGLALCHNAFVDYRGGASNRAGTAIVGQCRDSTEPVRFIPFQFSVLQSYILEFSHLRMRVIKDGGYVLEPAKNITAITKANPGVVTSAAHGFTEGATVFISGVAGMTQVNDRFFRATNVTTDTFQLRKLNVNPNTSPSSDNIDTSAYGTYTSGGTVSRVFTLTTPYEGDDLFDIGFTQNADVMTLTHTSYATRDLTRTDHHVWTLTEKEFASSTPTPTGLATAQTNLTGSNISSYKVTAIGANGEESFPTDALQINGHPGGGSSLTLVWDPVPGAIGYNIYRGENLKTAAQPSSTSKSFATYGFLEFVQGARFVDGAEGGAYLLRSDITKTPPQHRNPFAHKAIESIIVNSGGSAHTNSTTITVTDSTGTGALVRPVIQAGVIIDVVVENGGKNYTNPAFAISPGTGASLTATLGPDSGNSPDASAYFQQRLALGGTLNGPDRFVLSRPGYPNNMDVSNPVRDDDAIDANIASQQVNKIQSMVPMPGGLVILTTGGAWQISGGGSINEPVTPANAVATPQSYNGASKLPPIVINNNILFVQRERSVIRNLQYDFFANIYTGTDVTVLASHLFFRREIVDWSYAEEPFKVIWIVRDDGRLISLTYLREQEVIGYGQHQTQGVFESSATIVENNESVTYFVVKRYIEGKWLKFAERMASRKFSDSVGQYIGEDGGWFLDSAVATDLTYPAADLSPADLSPAAGSGTAVVMEASAAIFTAADIGKVFRSGSARGLVTAQTTTTITVNLDREFEFEQLDQDDLPETIEQGKWSLTAKFSSLGGLHHLEGKTVKILGDGEVLDSQVVVDGFVPLELNEETYPVSYAIAGLGFRARIKTLPIDTGDPTSQGKRKKLSALTARVTETKRIKAGSTFADAKLFKFQGRRDGNARMVTDDIRMILNPDWNSKGQLCLEQSNPLPMTVLGVIPEITVGDNTR